MASIPDDKTNIFRRSKSYRSLDVCRTRGIDSVPDIVAEVTGALPWLERITALVREERCHHRRRRLVADCGQNHTLRKNEWYILNLLELPLLLQALARCVIEGRTVARRTKRDRGYKPPTYGTVQLVPVSLGRPCLVSGEGLALAGGLAAGKMSAEEGEPKERESHCIALLARRP